MRYGWCVVLFLFVGGMMGCPASQTRDERVSTPQKKESNLRVQDYFPLRVGDQRTYQVSYGKGHKKRFTVRMIRKKGAIFLDDATPQQSYKINAYGLLSETFGPKVQKRYLLKNPIRVGLKWLSIFEYEKVERYVILSINELVRTPAGLFKDCVVVRSRIKLPERGGSLEMLSSFAPGVGLARIQTFFRVGGQRIRQWTIELVSYKKGP